MGKNGKHIELAEALLVVLTASDMTEKFRTVSISLKAGHNGVDVVHSYVNGDTMLPETLTFTVPQ